MGQKKNVDMSQTQAEVKVVETDSAAQDQKKGKKKAVSKLKQARSKKYGAVRAQVDKTKQYEPLKAIELVKKLSYSKFTGSLEAHGVVRKIGSNFSITFPNSTGKTLKIAIADEKTLKDIAEGKINFDILLANKASMPKLMKHAKTLGPKGLMPNPKNGTLTEDLVAKKKELEAGSITLKTEKKAPLIHLIFGKTNDDSKKLLENLEALIKAVGTDLIKLSISSSMSPGVKIKLD